MQSQGDASGAETPPPPPGALPEAAAMSAEAMAAVRELSGCWALRDVSKLLRIQQRLSNPLCQLPARCPEAHWPAVAITAALVLIMKAQSCFLTNNRHWQPHRR